MKLVVVSVTSPLPTPHPALLTIFRLFQAEMLGPYPFQWGQAEWPKRALREKPSGKNADGSMRLQALTRRTV